MSLLLEGLLSAFVQVGAGTINVHGEPEVAETMTLYSIDPDSLHCLETNSAVFLLCAFSVYVVDWGKSGVPPVLFKDKL